MKSDVIEVETVTITKAEYESMKHQIAWLMEQITQLKRRAFGVSSQQLDADTREQISLFDEEETPSDRNLPEPELEEITYKRKRANESKTCRGCRSNALSMNCRRKSESARNVAT